MPYRITWLEQTVIVDFIGDVSIEEVREQGRKLNGDPRFKSVRKRILNCSRAGRMEATASDMKIFAFIDKEAVAAGVKVHMAVVGDRDQYQFHIDSYEEAFGKESGLIELFDSIGDALAWAPE